MDNFPKNMGRQLPGHISSESAFVVQNYPYGFVQRCQIRYWIEENERGQRFVSQTLHPKTGCWNKPRLGAYASAVIMYLETDSGHVRSLDLSYYDPLEVWEAWAERFVLPDQTKKDVALFIASKRAGTYSHTGAQTMYNTTTKQETAPLYVKGTDLSPSDRRAALTRYAHRFTAEHVPTWALKPRATGDYYAPQFRSDAEWLENTTFRTRVVGGRTRLGGECETTGQTWPFGKSLPAPYSARSNQPDL